MTASSFDQQAWLKRIGYGGPLEPTLGTLRQLIFAHSHAIAYESLDIMLGRTPKLDVGALQRKMIFGGPIEQTGPEQRPTSSSWHVWKWPKASRL